MARVQQAELVPYGAQSMFELVNDIDAYPQFLPWCARAWVTNRSEWQLRAGLAVAKGKLNYSFTTDNTLFPFHRIEMRLVDGPFRHLEGGWRFDEQPVGCRIELNLEFEFSNRVVGVALTPAFKAITTSLVGSFRQRAHQLYGR